MKQALGYEIGGLKCDAKDCDYQDDTIKLEAYVQCVNKPCPKCGANLLTEADYKAVAATIAACDWINSLGLPLTDKDPTFKISLGLDGTGIPKPQIVPLSDSGTGKSDD